MQKISFPTTDLSNNKHPSGTTNEETANRAVPEIHDRQCLSRSYYSINKYCCLPYSLRIIACFRYVSYSEKKKNTACLYHNLKKSIVIPLIYIQGNEKPPLVSWNYIPLDATTKTRREYTAADNLSAAKKLQDCRDKPKTTCDRSLGKEGHVAKMKQHLLTSSPWHAMSVHTVSWCQELASPGIVRSKSWLKRYPCT